MPPPLPAHYLKETAHAQRTRFDRVSYRAYFCTLMTARWRPILLMPCLGSYCYDEPSTEIDLLLMSLMCQGV